MWFKSRSSSCVDPNAAVASCAPASRAVVSYNLMIFLAFVRMHCRLGASIQTEDVPCHVLIPPDWMLSVVIATLTGCQWLMSFSVWDNWFCSLSAPVWERTKSLELMRPGLLSVRLTVCLCVCVFTACFSDGLQH